MQGELASITYPSGRYLYYKFDSAGRVNGLHQNPGGVSGGWADQDLVVATSYTSAGQLATLDAGRRETRTYNNLLQLAGIQVASATAALDLSYVYPAGANDGRISAEINNGTGARVDYTYDQLNRLSTAVSRTGATTNWGLQFGYDIYGNRTSQTVTAGSAPQSTFAFDNNNRMIGYSYDANGNQLSTPDGGWLEYDADNRMSKWSKPATGATENYQYHPSGWRVWKGASYASGFFSLYGPGGQLLSEGTSTHYVYFGGRLLYTMSGSSRTAVYRDRLGSTRYTENQQASLTRNYYPFSEEITATASDTYKFADTYRDSTSGLDYALNRYYSSNTGRFLTPDPLGAGAADAGDPRTWNRYTYAGNDPANYTDSQGLRMCLGSCWYRNWFGGDSPLFGLVYPHPDHPGHEFPYAGPPISGSYPKSVTTFR